MRVTVVIEAIPPYCGGAEQVAWVHALEMAKRHSVSVVTFGEHGGTEVRDGVTVHYLPQTRRKFLSYLTTHRTLLTECIAKTDPSIVHCHMPNVLSACIKRDGYIFISTIHDGVPEDERVLPWAQWLKFKLIRRINLRKSDVVTCVSRHNLERMRTIYPSYAAKFRFIPNPIHARLFTPVSAASGSHVLNFGRQIKLKMGSLIEVARRLSNVTFEFVGTGEMVRDYGLPNIRFIGFSDAVEEHIDSSAICVFPSESENFPLVGLEAMARGKPVIATKRGFSEYIEHERNGFLLESTDPDHIADTIARVLQNADLRKRIGLQARATAEEYQPSKVVSQYEELYQELLT